MRVYYYCWIRKNLLTITKVIFQPPLIEIGNEKKICTVISQTECPCIWLNVFAFSYLCYSYPWNYLLLLLQCFPPDFSVILNFLLLPSACLLAFISSINGFICYFLSIVDMCWVFQLIQFSSKSFDNHTNYRLTIWHQLLITLFALTKVNKVELETYTTLPNFDILL